MVKPISCRAIVAALFAVLLTVTELHADPRYDDAPDQNRCFVALSEMEDTSRPGEIALCQLNDDQHPVPGDSEATPSSFDTVLLLLDPTSGTALLAIIQS